MKYSPQELNEVLLAATPDQLAELRAISEVFDISMDEVCTEVLKLINAKFPISNFVFSTNCPLALRRTSRPLILNSEIEDSSKLRNLVSCPRNSRFIEEQAITLIDRFCACSASIFRRTPCL